MNLLTSMRYLVALNEHRHFARAAQACHITQPALSNALRALEEEFGIVIVRRGRVFAGLTPEGEQVLGTALSMLKAEESLRQNLSARAGQLKGQLRMAAVPTALPMLTRFAAMLRAQHPGITPMVLSMSSLELESGLEDLSIDLALGYDQRMSATRPRTARSSRVDVWRQYLEHYYLLEPGRKGQGLKKGKPASWAQAAQRPLVLLTPDMHNRLVVDEGFAAADCPCSVALETNSVLTLTLSVTDCGLSSVLPGALVATLNNAHDLNIHPLISPQIETSIAFMAQPKEAATLALRAATELLQRPLWQQQCQRYAGALGSMAAGQAV